MSGSAVLATFVAVVVALSGFAGLSLSAPVGYPEDSLLEEELIREIVFDEGEYRSPCIIRGRVILVNPTDSDIVTEVEYPVNWHVFSENENPGFVYGEVEMINVTVPAGGEYRASFFSFRAYEPGYYEVDWGGFRRGIHVSSGELIPRIVTEKNLYEYGENGYLTFEYYNPKPYPVTLTRPTRVLLELWVDGVDQQTGVGSYIDYFNADVTVKPGEAVKIQMFYFTTYKPGINNYRGMGASVSFRVRPRAP